MATQTESRYQAATADNRIYPIPATIDISEDDQVSLAADLQGGTLCGYILPATFTGTALTFQISDSANGTYVDLYDTTNTQVSHTVTQGRGYAFTPGPFAGAQFLKVVSGSNEGADRVITLLCRKID